MESKNIKHLAQRVITDEIFSAVETILVKHLLFAKERHSQFLLGLIENQQEDESQKQLEEVQAICDKIYAHALALDSNIDHSDQNIFAHPNITSPVVESALNSKP